MTTSNLVILSIVSVLLYPVVKPLGWILGGVAMLGALLFIGWFLGLGSSTKR